VLKGRTAVVTGSTSGIGLGIAEALAGQGCGVALNSFTDSDADHAIADRLAKAHGVDARYIRADMSKPEECRALVERAAEALGPVQILVNNAGVQHVARVASPFKSAYVSAKHGLVGLTKTVALELAEEGITCNAICPGYVLTPLVENQIADQMKVHGLPRERVVKDVMLQRQPTREFARVEDVGALTVFLCSDAAAQITGTTLSIDGGWTAL
jgi:3-hydroxybutyrate dehydrogenase